MTNPSRSAETIVELVTHDLVDKSQEEPYRKWFETVVLPKRLGVDGCVSCQHYGLVLGDLPSHLVVYEYAGRADGTAASREARDDAQWPQGKAPIFKETSRRSFKATSRHRAASAVDAPIAGGGMLMVLADIDPKVEGEFDEWYEQEHIPERLALAGAVAARRFLALEGTPKFLAIWEVLALDDFSRPDFRFKLTSPPSPWTNRMRREMSQSRGVYGLLGDYRR